jgi:hypothetical protein
MSEQWTLGDGQWLWQDTKGTVPVTAEGQPVGAISNPLDPSCPLVSTGWRSTARRDERGRVYIDVQFSREASDE